MEMTQMRIANQDLKNQLSNGILNQDLKPEPSVAAAGTNLEAGGTLTVLLHVTQDELAR